MDAILTTIAIILAIAIVITLVLWWQPWNASHTDDAVVLVEPALVRESYVLGTEDGNRVLQMTLPENALVTTYGNIGRKRGQGGEHLFFIEGGSGPCWVDIDRPSTTAKVIRVKQAK